MPQGINDIFGIYEKSLMVRTKKAEIIANNITNADTPGYKARDLDFKEVLGRYVRNQPMLGHMSKTSDMHVGSLIEASSMEGVKYRQSMQPSLDGNSVDMHVEKTAYTENALRLEASFTFLNGKIKGIMGALRGD